MQGSKPFALPTVEPAMPHFHLHIYNRVGEVWDEEGEALPSLDHARHKAIEGVRSILSAEVLDGSFDLRGRIDIATPDGAVLHSLRFREAVQLYLDQESE
jgi:hypothetical protein